MPHRPGSLLCAAGYTGHRCRRRVGYTRRASEKLLFTEINCDLLRLRSAGDPLRLGTSISLGASITGPVIKILIKLCRRGRRRRLRPRRPETRSVGKQWSESRPGMLNRGVRRDRPIYGCRWWRPTLYGDRMSEPHRLTRRGQGPLPCGRGFITPRPSAPRQPPPPVTDSPPPPPPPPLFSIRRYDVSCDSSHLLGLSPQCSALFPFGRLGSRPPPLRLPPSEQLGVPPHPAAAVGINPRPAAIF